MRKVIIHNHYAADSEGISGAYNRKADRYLSPRQKSQAKLVNQWQFSASPDHVTGQDSAPLLIKGSKVLADLPSGWKTVTLVDNLYSGMSTVRVEIGPGQVRTVPVKRLKVINLL